MNRPALILTVLLALGPPALAADLPTTATLPSLALDPQAPPPSIWNGLYVGSDLFVAGAKGSKPGVGGGAFVGYDRHFDNNLVLGVQASSGYSPFVIPSGPYRGFDYAEVSAKVGYEMGRFTPYLLTGIALAKPNGAPSSGYLSAADSADNVFNGGASLAASGVFGAGLDYKLTSNTTIGIAAVVGAGRGFVPPPP